MASSETILKTPSLPHAPEPADLCLRGNTVFCTGTWTALTTTPLFAKLDAFTWPADAHLIIDGSLLHALDLNGAVLLLDILKQQTHRGVQCTLQAFKSEHQSLMEWGQQHPPPSDKTPASPASEGRLDTLGRAMAEGYQSLKDFFCFTGKITESFIQFCTQRSPLAFRIFLKSIEQTGAGALPIIALLSCMIGVVLAYQTSVQLKLYGADIFVVDLLGISMLREFAPLMTAIIIAARTSSALTAELGLMKRQQELDALKTLNANPYTLLIVPKLLGLLITLPLLVVWADCFGIFGGMLMSCHMLGFSAADFLTRFQDSIGIQHFFIGLFKAPVFACIIGLVGCFEGLRVSGTAQSIGKRTTRSVVLAIFLIITADAFFSILFSGSAS